MVHPFLALWGIGNHITKYGKWIEENLQQSDDGQAIKIETIYILA